GPSPPNSVQRHPAGRFLWAERLHRSEEHTSELQSLTNLVCRLLLEKKIVYYANTRDDAASIGFDDSMIYDEIRVDTDSRKIPLINLCRKDALTVFFFFKDTATTKIYSFSLQVVFYN